MRVCNGRENVELCVEREKDARETLFSSESGPVKETNKKNKLTRQKLFFMSWEIFFDFIRFYFERERCEQGRKKS